MITVQSEMLKGVREGFGSLQAKASERASQVVGRVRPVAEQALKVTGDYRRTVDGLAERARATGRERVGALAGGLRKMADRLDEMAKAPAH